MKNSAIKKKIKKEGLYLWQIADYIGITDSALSKRFRYKLSDDEVNTIENAIKELKKNDRSK